MEPDFHRTRRLPPYVFAWAPFPEAFAAPGSLEFSKLLRGEARVAVAPGIGFGEYGDGHVRIALVENERRIRQAARSIRQFVGAADPSRSRGRLRLVGN